MRTWYDKYWGVTGIGAWVAAIGVNIVFGGMYLFGLITANRWQDIVGVTVIFGLPLAWGYFYISQIMTVFQSISLDGNKLTGKLYFGKKVSLDSSEVQSLSYYPMTWKIRQINIFDRNQPGINVALNNGKVLRINSKTEEFADLVGALKAWANIYPEIKCQL